MANDNDEITPERLKAARALLGLNQMKAAARVGVHMQTWATWEQGRASATTGLIRQALLKFLKRAERSE